VGRHCSNRISFRKKRYPQNTATCNTSLDFFHFSTRPVNIEGANDNHLGIGILFTMYSQTTSTLYLSCPEIGITRAPSAIVPWYNHSR
jgi:hypothetical protein